MSACTELPPEVVHRFQEDGAVVLRGVFSPRWVQLIREGIRFNLREPSKYAQSLKASEDSGVYFNDYCNWRRVPEFHQYVKFSPAANIAATLTSSKEVRFYHEHVLDKSPGTGVPTPWHQDQPYYPIDGSQVCSVWMPVDPVPLGSSLRLVRGSHRWGRWFQPRMFATSQNYDLISPLSNKYESLCMEEMDTKHEILEWAMEPGDCVVFHMLTVHGAAGNTSSFNHRRVMATRWLGDDAVLASRPWQVSPPMEAVFNQGEKHLLEQLPVIWGHNP